MAEKQNTNTTNWLDKIYVWILLIIFGGIVFHAPITVALTTLFPDFDLLIKSWKEILMLLAGLVAIYLLYRHKKFNILRDPIILAIAAYAVLHLVLLGFKFQGVTAAFAGLAIDLRYLLFFALAYIAIILFPQYRKTFIKIGIITALIAMVFAFLQAFVLPKDVLKFIGYGPDTIQPYLTIDQNESFYRINGTMRGPNPLGAYAAMILTLLTVAFLRLKLHKNKKTLAGAIVLTVCSVVALYFSYSRSAWIAAILSIVAVIITVIYKKISIKQWAIAGGLVLVIIGGLFAVKDSNFISNVILHENPVQGNNINSNEGHIDSLGDGFSQMLRQPIGAGIGSTGSASLLSNRIDFIENQYLFVAHEVGWLGLALFIAIFVMILKKLWRLRSDWLALGVFASGLGLAIIGLFLPVWADDTVSILWWGLAAIAIIKNRLIK